MAKTLGDLRKALEGLPDDLVLFISDGHEAVSQFSTHVGVVPNYMVGDCGYVEDDTPEAKEYTKDGLASQIKTAEKLKWPRERIARLQHKLDNLSWVPAIQIDTGC